LPDRRLGAPREALLCLGVPTGARARDVAAELDRYFDALTAQRSFRPDA
jgi:hypothetical protein